MPNTPKLPEDVEKRWNIFQKEVFSLHSELWLYDKKGTVDLFRQLLAQELANLKAQVRREIEEKKEINPSFELAKLRNELINDCLSVESLKEEE